MKLSNDSFSRIHALVVGDVMLDRYWFGSVDRISPEAPVPVLAVTRETARAGGAANVAHNILALGAGSTLLSVVGDDAAGKEIAQIVEGYGANTRLTIDGSINTIVKLRLMAQNQQLLRADFDQHPSDEVLAQCLNDFQACLNDCDVVVLSDYGKGGLRHVSRMIEQARAAGKPVIIDPKGQDYSRYKGATLITPNMKEFEAVVGPVSDDAEFAEKALALCAELQLEYLLVTRSEKGMSLFARDGSRLDSPAKALEVYDVSGAGDTVIALMALAFVTDMNDAERLELANTGAGIVVGKLGTAVATIDEVLAAYNETKT
ncbi:MAG: D-glycero-beta-D-manno-heptose-7-phosphate kinase [Gammaproteobacteria bacterium]|nr:D-glycero-beta-D-manno-heptose-7-phosphate kinase [Gammaproteobacteria bacterium]